MKLLMISAFTATAVTLLAAATTMLRSHTPRAEYAVGSADMMSSQERRTAPDVNKLPIEDFEDQSLVFSRPKQ